MRQPLKIVPFITAGKKFAGISPDVDLQGSIILDNPSHSLASRLDRVVVLRICDRHDISVEDVLVLKPYQRAHNSLKVIPHAASICDYLNVSNHSITSSGSCFST